MRFRINLFLIIFVLFIFLNGYSQSKKNYLIVEDPFELNIFNKYEQNIAYKDSSIFLPFSPLEIIASDTVLSDNYTAAFIVRIENQNFYFLKSQPTLPVHRIFDSWSDYIVNATSLADTIQISQSDKISFFNAKDKNQKQRLKKETKLVRIFKKGFLTYVKNLETPVRYGWCNLSNKGLWQIYHSTTRENITESPEIESLIKEKLFEVNDILMKLFHQFNKLNRKTFPVPYWTYSHIGNVYTCSILNRKEQYDFKESTSILLNELQLALSHTNYSVFRQSDQIVIQINSGLNKN